MFSKEPHHFGGGKPDDVAVRPVDPGDEAACDTLDRVATRFVSTLPGHDVAPNLIGGYVSKPHPGRYDLAIENPAALPAQHEGSPNQVITPLKNTEHRARVVVVGRLAQAAFSNANDGVGGKYEGPRGVEKLQCATELALCYGPDECLVVTLDDRVLVHAGRAHVEVDAQGAQNLGSPG